MKFVKLFLVLFLACSNTCLFAQRNRPKPAVVTGFKPPKLSTSLGNLHDTMPVKAQDMVNALTMPLKITDAKNNVYSLSSYKFLYRQTVTTEDDSMTGKPSNTTAIKYSLFRSSPLPPLWSSLVGEQLRPGEEISFFEVIVKDAQGHVMYAPNIKITIQ